MWHIEGSLFSMVGTARRDQRLLRLDLVCEASGGRGERLGCIYIYICYIHSEHRIGVALFDREGSRAAIEGAEREQGAHPESTGGATREGAAREQEAQQRSKGSGSLY